MARHERAGPEARSEGTGIDQRRGDRERRSPHAAEHRHTQREISCACATRCIPKRLRRRFDVSATSCNSSCRATRIWKTRACRFLRGMEQLSQVVQPIQTAVAQLALATDSLVEGQVYQTLKALRALLPREERLACGRAELTLGRCRAHRRLRRLAFPVGGRWTRRFNAWPRARFQARDRDYFRENIGNVVTASQLVEDFRLRRVALSAFGLQDDLPNRAFIERVLGDGAIEPTALSNRLADKRYKAFFRGVRLWRTASAAHPVAGVRRQGPRPVRPAGVRAFRRRAGRKTCVWPSPRPGNCRSFARTRVAGHDRLVERLGQPAAPPRVRDRAGPARVRSEHSDLDRQVDEFRDARDTASWGSRMSHVFAEPSATEELVKELHPPRAACLGSPGDRPRACRPHASAGRTLRACARRCHSAAGSAFSARIPARRTKLSFTEPGDSMPMKASSSSQTATAASVRRGQPPPLYRPVLQHQFRPRVGAPRRCRVSGDQGPLPHRGRRPGNARETEARTSIAGNRPRVRRPRATGRYVRRARRA